METVFRHQLVVAPNATDPNGHVNNVAYVQWMQDAAIAHSAASGCTRITKSLGATWVVRSHRIEYRSPAFAGDSITIETWIENFRRVRSLRRYRILRTSDGAILAEGETDWVFVDAGSGRPKAIPPEIAAAFGVAAR